MAQETELNENANEPSSEGCDIFLCTRGLPDKLTAETAALRQLCAALIGSGYKVFFAPALPKDTPPEEVARAMASAAGSARVMIAAAVGDEGAQDVTARFLWQAFRQAARNDPSRRFIACSRDLSAQPEEFAGAEVLDMGDLKFLAILSQRLREALPGVGRAVTDFTAPEAPEAPEEPVGESASEEPSAEDPAASLDDKRRKFWLILAIGAIAVAALVVLLLLRIK